MDILQLLWRSKHVRFVHKLVFFSIYLIFNDFKSFSLLLFINFSVLFSIS